MCHEETNSQMITIWIPRECISVSLLIQDSSRLSIRLKFQLRLNYQRSVIKERANKPRASENAAMMG